MLFEPAVAVDVQGRLKAIGIEFAADATYEAPNRASGSARIPFLVKTPAKAADKKDSKTKTATDSLITRIYTLDGKLIRTLTQTQVDTGLNFIEWGLEEKGIRYPGSPKPKNKSDERGGLTAFPGTYKAVVQYGSFKDSVNVAFIADPRVPFSAEIYAEKRKHIDRIAISVQKLTEAMDRLDESNEIAARITAGLNGLENAQAKDLIKQAKAQQDSIKKIKEVLQGKRLDKQGYGRPYQLTATGKLNEAQGSILNKPSKPGVQEIKLIEQAEQLTKEFIDKVNAYFEKEWPAFRKKAEEIKVNPFKDYQAIN
jgi:hypothetical protein